jgi:hypothetical protein
MWNAWYGKFGDIKPDALQLCRDLFTQKKQAQQEQRAKIIAEKAVEAVTAQNPVRRKWKLQTQVATDDTTTVGQVPVKGFTKIVTLGTRVRVTSLWVRGKLKQFHGEAPCPYEIDWDTKPEPITKHRLFMGDVGLDLLWERDTTASSSTLMGHKRLQYGLVLPYDPLMKTYKILFRDGTYTFRNDEQLK